MIFQVGAALLDACVLSTLRHGDAYGYVLTQTLMGTLEISESTLYPVLRRLQKDEFLSTYDQPHMGRNRRYYKITNKGMARADVYRADWQEYKTRVDSLILSEGGPWSAGAEADLESRQGAEGFAGAKPRSTGAENSGGMKGSTGVDGETLSRQGAEGSGESEFARSERGGRRS